MSLPLLLLIFGMLELALVLLVVSTLDSAAEGAARQIRTGEFQTSAANTKDDFKALVCQRMSWLNGQCPTNLFLDVQTFSNFSGLAAAPAPDFTNDPAGHLLLGRPAQRHRPGARLFRVAPVHAAAQHRP